MMIVKPIYKSEFIGSSTGNLTLEQVVFPHAERQRSSRLLIAVIRTLEKEFLGGHRLSDTERVGCTHFIHKPVGIFVSSVRR